VSIKPGVKRSETPGSSTRKPCRAREAADSVRDYEYHSWRFDCRPLRGPLLFSTPGSWGFAALHPRLYAVGRFAGWY